MSKADLRVEPGIVLDDLTASSKARARVSGRRLYASRHHRRHGGNNSCGGRSLRYGTMRDNTLSMDAALADGRCCISARCRGIWRRELAPERLRYSVTCSISASARPRRYPSGFQRCSAASAAQSRCTGAAQCAEQHGASFGRSEGTLAFTTQVELKLWLSSATALGVCHFGSFTRDGCGAASVKLRPIAVELVDRTMIALGRDIAMFQPIIAPRCAAIRRGAGRGVRREDQEKTASTETLANAWPISVLAGRPQRKWRRGRDTEPALQTGIADFAPPAQTS